MLFHLFRPDKPSANFKDSQAGEILLASGFSFFFFKSYSSSEAVSVGMLMQLGLAEVGEHQFCGHARWNHPGITVTITPS